MNVISPSLHILINTFIMDILRNLWTLFNSEKKMNPKSFGREKI